MNIDTGGLKDKLSAVNSALKASVIADEMERSQRIVTEINRQSVQRDATLVAGAEASVEQKNLIEQQLEILNEQNMLLLDNYEKLKEMYNAQVQANKQDKVELDKSRKYNMWMMVVSIISMLAAVASTIISLLL